MKRIVTALFIILSLVVSGCGVTRTEEPEGYNYRKGTEGLVIEFPVGLPDQLYEGDKDVKFLVEVKNKGAFPQSNEEGFSAYLWIGGFDKKIIAIEGENKKTLSKEELEGKSPYNKEGGYTSAEFQADIKELPSGAPFYKPTMLFSVTYFYKTIAGPMVCIDPEPRSTHIKDKVCTVEDITLSGGQGAPIAVTKVEEDVTGSHILFKISIQNGGGGLVIPTDGTTKFDSDPNKGYEWGEVNKVTISKVEISGTLLTCTPKINQKVQLIDGKGYIFCKLDKDSVGDEVYTAPLNIELTYGYSDSVSNDIEIFEQV